MKNARSAKAETSATDQGASIMADKALATLLAQFALAGHEIHQLAPTGFLVTRWGLTKHCPDIEALRAFARRVGVKHGV